MKTDRELIELAARAFGRWSDKSKYIENVYDYDSPHRGSAAIQWDEYCYDTWNPLTDDGDRHRLLIALKMTLAHEPSRGGWSVGAVVSDKFRWLAFDEDEARTIVCAAAEIGERMP